MDNPGEMILMRPEPGGTNFVVNGSWNKRLFAPEWVQQNLNQGAPVEMQISPGNPELPYLFHLGDCRLVVSESRLVVGTASAENDQLQAACLVMVQVLSLLTHTPVVAAGFNYCYVIHSNPALVSEMRSGPVQDRITNINGVNVVKGSLTVQLRLEDVPFQFALSEAGNGESNLKFNFHRETRSKNEMVEHFQRHAEFREYSSTVAQGLIPATENAQ